jgi:hypothetical protein
VGPFGARSRPLSPHGRSSRSTSTGCGSTTFSRSLETASSNLARNQPGRKLEPQPSTYAWAWRKARRRSAAGPVCGTVEGV